MLLTSVDPRISLDPLHLTYDVSSTQKGGGVFHYKGGIEASMTSCGRNAEGLYRAWRLVGYRTPTTVLH